MVLIRKAGASHQARPAVQTAFTATGNAGSHSVAASKLRALAEAMGGPCIVRDADGRGFLLTVEALKFIPVHEVRSI